MNTNPINQVLVVTNAALHTATQRLDQLGVGQLGIFNADTNLAVTAALPARFYFAVGVANSAGTLGDIRKSTGEYITKTRINSFASKHPETATDQVFNIDLTNFTPSFDTDYTIRGSFLSGHILSQNGFTLPIKSFTIHTPCVGDCTGDMDLDDFIDQFVTEINNDPEALVVASNVTDTTLRLTVKSEALATEVGGINPNYSKLRQLTATFALSGGFEVGGYTTANTPATFAQGLGYDIRREEYVAAGWKGEPGIYRDSDILGQFFGATEIFAVAGTKYWTARLNYDIDSNSGGMLKYTNKVETLIAIPDLFANKTIMDALIALFPNTLVGNLISSETTELTS